MATVNEDAGHGIPSPGTPSIPDDTAQDVEAATHANHPGVDAVEQAAYAAVKASAADGHPENDQAEDMAL